MTTSRTLACCSTSAAPGARWQVSRDGGVHPRWSPKGGELYYYAADQSMMVAPITPEAARPVGTSMPLFRERLLTGPTVSVGFGPQYDVAADGRFLLNLPVAPLTRPPFTSCCT